MENKKMSDPGCWCTFIFAALMWMSVASSLGILQGDMYLMVGVISLITLPFWIMAAKMYYNVGNDIMGHFYMVFGILFGGLCGSAHIVLYLGHVFPALAVSENVVGIFYLVGALFMLPIIPSLFYMDIINLITWLACTLWMLAGGLLYFFSTSTVLYLVYVISCIILTIGITYMMFNEAVFACYGKHLPMGKPLKMYDDVD